MSRLTVNLARETLPLLQDARRSFVLANPNLNPSDSAAIDYGVSLIRQFKKEGGSILWADLMDPNFDFSRFALTYAFPRSIRYRTTIDRAIVPKLDGLCNAELSPCFKGKIYRNFLIRAVLRASYALTHESEFRDVLIRPTKKSPEPL